MNDSDTTLEFKRDYSTWDFYIGRHWIACLICDTSGLFMILEERMGLGGKTFETIAEATRALEAAGRDWLTDQQDKAPGSV